jgi:uncharacterized repeat protein (TIGR01451 family)
MLIGLLAYLLTGLFSQAFAGELLPSCHPIYGGGENCISTGSIEINKTVQNPKDSKFVENLGQNDPKYSPGQNIQFQITVKNSSGNNINNITIKDNLPRYVNCDFSGIGVCDNSNRVITININTLNRNEAHTMIIKGKIATLDKMQNEPQTFCLINQAKAIQGKQSIQDNAQFCIQNNPKPTPIPTQPPASTTTKGGKQVFPASTTQTTPKTGPEALSLASLLSLAAAGFWLRRKTK